MQKRINPVLYSRIKMDWFKQDFMTLIAITNIPFIVYLGELKGYPEKNKYEIKKNKHKINNIN